MSLSSDSTIAFASLEWSGSGADAACDTHSGTDADVDARATTQAINTTATRNEILRTLIDCSPGPQPSRWARRLPSAQPVPDHRRWFSDRNRADRGIPKPYKKGWPIEEAGRMRKYCPALRISRCNHHSARTAHHFLSARSPPSRPGAASG